MFRITPAVGAHAYKTYEIRAPLSTHWRPASCAEAGCEQHERGWRSVIDESTELGQRQAHYIRRESGRRFTEEQQGPGVTAFVFEAGQTCFAASKHRVRVGRPELYVVRGGDWRGNPAGLPTVTRSVDDWVDDFGEHQQRIADRIEQG